MSLHDDALIEAAADLTRQAGRPTPVALTPLAGGNNNRVFQVDLVQGDPLILKSYFSDPRDPRDRLGAEWSFATYAWQRGVRCLPEPLAQDPGRRLGLYARLPGRKLSAGQVGAEHVTAAVDFILAVNAAPRDPLALAPGSEACFCLAEHVATVARRVDRLATLDESAPHIEQAKQLVAQSLTPAWHDVRLRIETQAQASPDLAAELGVEDLVVSPSDFGFHNALVEGGTVSFLDFEYAGRDDPAKLVCDFFCQPDIPVPIQHLDLMLDRLVGGLALSDRHRARVALLLDLYRIKWACIILNPFLTVAAARRRFAREQDQVELCAAALAGAAAKLAEIRI